MKHLSTYYSGNFITDKGVQYDVRGFLTSLAKGHFIQFPEDYFISFSYRAVEQGDGFLPFPQAGEGYLKKVGDAWVIGTVIEKNQIQSFKEIDNAFFKWLKDAIINAYEEQAKKIK